jgi:hypothetical protein
MLFTVDFSILPESPRWLISKQRYEDAGLLLHRIAERNKKEFNPTTYQRFVNDDKKVNKQINDYYLLSICIILLFCNREY